MCQKGATQSAGRPVVNVVGPTHTFLACLLARSCLRPSLTIARPQGLFDMTHSVSLYQYSFVLILVTRARIVPVLQQVCLFLLLFDPRRRPVWLNRSRCMHFLVSKSWTIFGLLRTFVNKCPRIIILRYYPTCRFSMFATRSVEDTQHPNAIWSIDVSKLRGGREASSETWKNEGDVRRQTV